MFLSTPLFCCGDSVWSALFCRLAKILARPPAEGHVHTFSDRHVTRKRSLHHLLRASTKQIREHSCSQHVGFVYLLDRTMCRLAVRPAGRASFSRAWVARRLSFLVSALPSTTALGKQRTRSTEHKRRYALCARLWRRSLLRGARADLAALGQIGAGSSNPAPAPNSGRDSTRDGPSPSSGLWAPLFGRGVAKDAASGALAVPRWTRCYAQASGCAGSACAMVLRGVRAGAPAAGGVALWLGALAAYGRVARRTLERRRACGACLFGQAEAWAGARAGGRAWCRRPAALRWQPGWTPSKRSQGDDAPGRVAGEAAGSGVLAQDSTPREYGPAAQTFMKQICNVAFSRATVALGAKSLGLGSLSFYDVEARFGVRGRKGTQAD